MHFKYELIENTKEDNYTFCLNLKEKGNKAMIADAIIADLEQKNALTETDWNLIHEGKLFYQLYDNDKKINQASLVNLTLAPQRTLQRFVDNVDKIVRNAATYIHNQIPKTWLEKLYEPFNQLSSFFSSTNTNLFVITPPWYALHDKSFYIGLFWKNVLELKKAINDKQSKHEIKNKLIDLQEWAGTFIPPRIYVLVLKKLKTYADDDTVLLIENVLKNFYLSCSQEHSWLERAFASELKDRESKKSKKWFNFYASFLPSTAYFAQLKLHHDFLNELELNQSSPTDLAAIASQKSIVFNQIQKMYSEHPEVRQFVHDDVLTRLQSMSSSQISNELNAVKYSLVDAMKLAFKAGTTLLNYAGQHPFQTFTFSLLVLTVGTAVAEPIRQTYDSINTYNSIKRFLANQGNPEFLVNVNITGVQANPFIIKNGTTFSVLYDCFDGTSSDICVRAYSENAIPFSNQDKRLNTDTRVQQTTAVGICRNNEYQVFWVNNPSGTNADIWKNDFDSNWNPLSVESAVTNTLYNQLDPAIAQGPNNSLLVWQHGVSTINYDIHGYFLSAQGNLIGTEILVNNITSGNQLSPTLTWTGNGYVVAFGSTSAEGGTGEGIIARFMDELGTFLTGDLLVNTQTLGIQRSVKVGSNLQNGLFAWQDSDNNIYGRFFSTSGQLQGTQFRINTLTSATNPIVTVLASNNYLITYDINDGSTFDVYGQEITSGGTFVNQENRLNLYNAGNQQNTAAIGFPSGDFKYFITAWQGAFSSDSDGIVARYFNISQPATTGLLATSTTGIAATISSSSTSATATISSATSSSATISSATIATTGQSPITSSSGASGTSSTLTSLSPSTTSFISATLTSATTTSGTTITSSSFTTSLSTSSFSSSTTNVNTLSSLTLGTTNTPTTTLVERSSSSNPSSDNALAIGLGVAGATVVVCAATLTAVGIFRKCRHGSHAGLLFCASVLERLNDTNKDERFQTLLLQFLNKLQKQYKEEHKVNLFTQEDEDVSQAYAVFIANILNSKEYSQSKKDQKKTNLIKANDDLEKITQMVYAKFLGGTKDIPDLV